MKGQIVIQVNDDDSFLVQVSSLSSTSPVPKHYTHMPKADANLLAFVKSELDKIIIENFPGTMIERLR